MLRSQYLGLGLVALGSLAFAGLAPDGAGAAKAAEAAEAASAAGSTSSKADAIPVQDRGPGSAALGRPSLAPLIEEVRPSVVGVTTIVKARRGLPPEVEEYWRRFFGKDAPTPRGPDNRMGIGSGVIIDAAGIILTNNHVVQGAEKVLVKTSDEQEHEARVVGVDPETDIAVLRIENGTSKLQAATLGDSDALQVGDYVVAIGNPFGLELTVTSGIISAKARVIGATPFDDFLQTDAAINPGNSGGPLFDLDGRVVGINTAIVASGQGIGFAVPIDLIKSLLPQLQASGKVVRGYLGVGVQDLTPELAQALRVGREKGALVSSVEPDGPAAKANLHPGDTIIALGKEPVESASELSRRVAQQKPGSTVELEILRGGKKQTVRVELGERPNQQRSGEPAHEPEAEEGPVGLSIVPLPEEVGRELGLEGGAMVAAVEGGSRAAEAGIQAGDVIVEADRKPVRSPKDLIEIADERGDDPLALLVRRGGASLYLVIPPE